MLWRVQHGNLDHLRPRVVVLPVGVNNSYRRDTTPETIADGVAAIIEELRARLPHGRILTHLGLPSTPPALSPARLPEQTELFEDDTMWGQGDKGRHGGGRGPPRGQDTGTMFESDGREDDGDRAA